MVQAPSKVEWVRQRVQAALIALIVFYQHTLSPDHGPRADITWHGCRYYPSCSEYMKRAIIRKGILRGLVSGCWWIIRCNPFSRGGVDEP